MNDQPKEEKERETSNFKEGLQDFGKKVEKGFQDFGKQVEKGFREMAEFVTAPFKEIKGKKWENDLKKAEQCPEAVVRKRQLKEMKKSLGGKLDNVGEKVDDIEDLAVQIKQDTSQLLLNDEQVLKLLEGINYKADNLEEIIAPLMPKLEETLGKVDNLESYMKDKLGSKWSKLRYQYQELQAGNITRKKFILTGFMVLGKTFLQVFAKVQA